MRNVSILETWRTESDLKADYDRVQVATAEGRKQLPVVPDSFFMIVANDRRYPFFLELDRGTMELKRVQAKALAYREYYRQGGYERRFGVKSLRVLLVTIGTKRAHNLKAKIEAIGESYWFWLTELQSVKAHDDILHDPIWYQSGKAELYSLMNIENR